MKLLMESWRKFLNERMEFGEYFEKWLHGESPEEPALGPMSMDVDDEEFGQAPHCKPRSIDPECLEEYGFEKIGEGTFREVWQLPDNPNYVMKIAGRGWGEPGHEKNMNKAEADTITQTGYPELLPKVYERAKDYSWIVVERVEVYEDDSWIDDFFPAIKEFWKANRNNKDFHWKIRPGKVRRTEKMTPERFFSDYVDIRKGEIRQGHNSLLTKMLGGEENRKKLEKALPAVFTRLVELVNEQQIAKGEIRAENVGKSSDGRFVLLDLGWGLEQSKSSGQIIPAKVHPPKRKYAREKR